MAEEKYFEKALSDFMFDTASGGEIRHYADNGYTVRQIMKMLDFPTPEERVQKAVREHFLEKGVLLYEEPGTGRARTKAEYVVEFDRYGRKSFRKIPEERQENIAPAVWREKVFDGKRDGVLADFLERKCAENGEEFSYGYCDFGLRFGREPKRFSEVLKRALDPDLRDYIEGLFGERRPAWHRLDGRMRKIIAALYTNGDYHGDCYFLKTGEKVAL